MKAYVHLSNQQVKNGACCRAGVGNVRLWKGRRIASALQVEQVHLLGTG